MARAEVTGKKPRVTADRARRRKDPPRTDPDVVELTSHDESESNDCTKAPLIPPAVYTIASFCLAHSLSESMFHKMRGMGIGPREMRIGARVFVTYESASAWRKAREDATPRTAAAMETTE